MHSLKINHLAEILKLSELPIEQDFCLEINNRFIEGKGEDFLKELFECLGGRGNFPLLDRIKFDFKINRYVFIYDDAVHFNRYRLNSLKTSIYQTFAFPWADIYKRLCRNYEKECLKAGVQERIWKGPPIAGRIFGNSELAGDLSGNGASGWKLNAYNDAQYDLISRLHGYKLVRIPMYENLMIGGSLKRIDELLLRPTEDNSKAILSWLNRKIL
ncbi:hypothetical protein [Cecembia sp.]|uniref:DUF7255 family protein n=1 Tax=Cecembia sp. TaxID=1898110 RepID=UPI0025BD8FFD|nr:hypothetical protein [Cecembia sp.]